jgi:hypothetical protein
VKQWIKTFVAGRILSLALFGSAMSWPFQDACSAFERHDVGQR